MSTMHLIHSRCVLLRIAIFTCATLVLSHPGKAAEPPIRLTAAQIASGRITFEKAIVVDAKAGGDSAASASLQLSGSIVIPNAALDVVLSPVAGRVESVLVNPGQKVSAGQVLATLYSGELVALQSDLIRTRSRAAVARTRADRDRDLHDAGIIARSRMEDSRAQLTEAESDLAEQMQLLRLAGFTDAALQRISAPADISPMLTIRARRAGTVLEQTAGVGDAMVAGGLMFRLAKLNGLWADLQATRIQAAQIRVGDAVRISGCQATGKVISAATALDSQSQTMTVRVEITGGSDCLSPNQYVEALISPRARKDVLISIPSGSVVQKGGENYVFVQKPAGLMPTVVHVERRTREVAWVTGEVKPGDEVASTGLAAIKGGWMGLGSTEEAAGEKP